MCFMIVSVSLGKNIQTKFINHLSTTDNFISHKFNYAMLNARLCEPRWLHF